MPELPDVELYVERLDALLHEQVLRRVRLRSAFLLRSVEPPLSAVEGARFVGARRLGKRVVLGFEGELFLVIHLMIAGRLRRRDPGAGLPGKRGLAAFDFDDCTLLLTEEGAKKRASLHVVRGEGALAEHDPGGLELFAHDTSALVAALRRGNHTLKRALTDPRLLAGIGNAYSDEILHRARRSPFQRTGNLSDDELAQLVDTCREVLREWTERLRAELGDGFPEKVTAFRAGMAAHGRYGEPCPVCASPIQRIVRKDTETNYCARCQTGGRLLADRALSKLLRDDWPARLEDLERRAPRGDAG